MAASHDGPSGTGFWHLRRRERGIDGDYGGRGDATGLQVVHVHGHAWAVDRMPAGVHAIKMPEP